MEYWEGVVNRDQLPHIYSDKVVKIHPSAVQVYMFAMTSGAFIRDKMLSL
jgi:hypothetical protein